MAQGFLRHVTYPGVVGGLDHEEAAALVGEPDLVLTMRPYTLRASGDDMYRHFVIPIPIAKQRFIFFPPQSRNLKPPAQNTSRKHC